MPSSKVSELTTSDIAITARKFRWNRQMPKWTVIVDGKEFPARPLVLEAAGVLPNDPTNSHQAVALLKARGFDVRYEGKATHSEGDSRPVSDEFIRSLRGKFKGENSMVAARERDHRLEKDRLAK